jgi:hypothetical protein
MQGFEILMVEKLDENGERFRGLLRLKSLCQATQGFKASAIDKFFLARDTNFGYFNICSNIGSI